MEKTTELAAHQAAAKRTRPAVCWTEGRGSGGHRTSLTALLSAIVRPGQSL